MSEFIVSFFQDFQELEFSFHGSLEAEILILNGSGNSALFSLRML